MRKVTHKAVKNINFGKCTLQHTKGQVKLFEMHCLTMFITALYVISIKTIFTSLECGNQNQPLLFDCVLPRFLLATWFYVMFWLVYFCFFLIGSFECGVQFGREVQARKIQAHERESRDLRKFSTHRFVRVSRVRVSFYLSPNWTPHSNEPIKAKQKYVDDKKRGKTQSYSWFGFPLIGWECGVRFLRQWRRDTW